MEPVHCASCEPMSEGGHEHNALQYDVLVRKTIIASIIGALFFANMILGIIPAVNTDSGYVINWCLAIVALAVLAYCGSHYFSGAWRAFRMHVATMDTLIALGTGAAWLYSCIVLIFLNDFPSDAQQVYFESATIIIALVNLGMVLEARARNQASSAISALLKLQPRTARIVRDNQEIDVEISTLKVNDIIRVRPGEQVPVDGIIIQGQSHIDESMLTGEADPKSKKTDDNVTGGTLNQNGTFLFKATGVGEKTVLAQIVQLVQKAQKSKPQLARLADQISAYFVPAVMIIAVITALIWYNIGPAPVGVHMLVAAMSVLIIACPCALGLAVPISVMIGVNKAAHLGIIFRHANALQQLTKITTVVLDKTGTITLGQPRVINVMPMPQYNNQKILSIAASLEAASEHPYAAAIGKAARADQIATAPITNFHAIPGLGITGDLNGEPVAIGNASFMEAQLINVDAMREQAKQCADHTQTLVYVGKSHTLIGAISIADPIKPDAKQAIKHLQDMKIKVVMITGDQLATAQAVAERVGITNIIANVMPQEKAAKITAMQEDGEKVAMVGDGINDAPALAKANVGIAVGTGTDIAIQSADITLVNGALGSIPAAIDLSHRTVANMKQNLFAAFIYNIIGIPIAAGILYPMYGVILSPMLAGTAMALSSLTVVSNANRLRLVKLAGEQKP